MIEKASEIYKAKRQMLEIITYVVRTNTTDKAQTLEIVGKLNVTTNKMLYLIELK